MSQALIFAPLFVMVLLTFHVGFLMLRLRIRAVKNGKISPIYFHLNRGGKLPEYLIKAEQNYTNLFEMPVLFYILGLTLFVTEQVNWPQLILAWTFVITRIIHSWIHLTHNKLIWRMRFFLAGVGILIFSWSYLVYTLYLTSI